MDNLEMFINTYKNWLNDVRVGGFALMGQFMEMEEALMKKLKNKLTSLSFWNWMKVAMGSR
jgi:hypothetical protein